ncbi:hypothetical protein [Paraglaciecola sp.]|uniref:hypothetical protein n=1 Tax=Paraglaciecola sp. TaxID=1920173 RepID=UPI0030F4A62A
MKKGTAFFLSIVILSLLLSYYLVVSNKPPTLEQSESKIVTDKTVSTSENQEVLSNKSNKTLSSVSHEETLVCRDIVHLKNYERKAKQEFILHKATLWWLEGTNKADVADTLAAKFSFKLATEWLDITQNISVYQNNIPELVDTLILKVFDQEAFNQTTNLSETLENYYVDLQTLSLVEERKQLDEITMSYIHQYPDLADLIWIKSANRAMELDLVNTAKDYLTNVANDVSKNRWSVNIWLSIFDLDKVKTLNQFEQAEIMSQLANIGPIYVSDKNETPLTEFQMRASILKEFLSIFEIKNTEKTSFIASSSISQRIDSLHQQFPLLATTLEPETLCALNNSEGVRSQTATMQTIVLTADKLKEEPYTSLTNFCLKPQMDMIGTFTAAQKFIDSTGLNELDLNSLETWETIDWGSVKSSLNQLKEDEKNAVLTVLFLGIFPDNSEQFSIYAKLIDNGIYVQQTDAAFLMSVMRNTKAASLIEKMTGLGDYDQLTGIGLPIISMLAENRLLALELINQDKPLRKDKHSLDPMLTAIEMLMDATLTEEELRQHIQLMEHFMTDIKDINMLHINAMAKLRLNNAELFEVIVANFPALFPNEPTVLLDFTCPVAS